MAQKYFMVETKDLKRGIVCIMDALGTKGIWNRNDPTETLQKWEALVHSFISLKNTVVLTSETTFSSPPNVKAFSDTIMITYHGDDLERLFTQMAVHILIPFCNAILDGIYLRGVITVGEYYESETSLIGPAIDEAIAWYEKGNWFGVFLTPSASYLVNTWTETFVEKYSSYYIKYDVPLNDNKIIKTWAINWPHYLGLLHAKNGKTTSAILQKSFSNATIFEEFYSKYDNSKEFLDYVIKNNL